MIPHTTRDQAVAHCDALATGDLCLRYHVGQRTATVAFRFAPEVTGEEFVSLRQWDAMEAAK